MSNSTPVFSATHIGQKLIKATPSTRQEYNDFRGWVLPDNEHKLGSVAGYTVEYEPHPTSTPNVEGYAGYISWSPKAVFDGAYKPLDAMTFGDAITMLKRGHKVARNGWNGKGMWIILNKGRVVENLEPNSFYERCGFEAPVVIQDHIDMKAADGSMVVGWLASQTDMLAEDWVIVD